MGLVEVGVGLFTGCWGMQGNWCEESCLWAISDRERGPAAFPPTGATNDRHGEGGLIERHRSIAHRVFFTETDQMVSAEP